MTMTSVQAPKFGVIIPIQHSQTGPITQFQMKLQTPEEAATVTTITGRAASVDDVYTFKGKDNGTFELEPKVTVPGADYAIPAEQAGSLFDRLITNGQVFTNDPQGAILEFTLTAFEELLGTAGQLPMMGGIASSAEALEYNLAGTDLIEERWMALPLKERVMEGIFDIASAVNSSGGLGAFSGQGRSCLEEGSGIRDQLFERAEKVANDPTGYNDPLTRNLLRDDLEDAKAFLQARCQAELLQGFTRPQMAQKGVLAGIASRIQMANHLLTALRNPENLLGGDEPIILAGS